MRRSHVYLALAAVAVGLLAVALTLMGRGGETSRAGAGESATTAEAPTVGGPFELVDSKGRTVTDRDFRGRWMLVFFGYTFCPDVCPTALANVALALERLGPLADRLVPIFISIDPERDTPEVVGEYVAQFDPRIVGLTGSPEQVRRAARAYRAFYRKVPAEENGGGDSRDYLMEHSAWIYLMGPDGEFVKAFPHTTDPDELAARIASAMGETLPKTTEDSSS